MTKKWLEKILVTFGFLVIVALEFAVPLAAVVFIIWILKAWL